MMAGTEKTAIFRRTALIASGTLLYAFITCHLLNLMLGLHSVALMDVWRPTLTGFWSTQPMGFLLLVSLIVHAGLALWQLYQRNSLRLPPYDAVQLICGLSVLPLLVPHVSGVIAADNIGVDVSYAYLLPFFWLSAPWAGFRQVLLLSTVWLHGSIGIYTWLNARESTRRWIKLYAPLAVAVPVLALLGYVAGGLAVVPPEMEGTGTEVALARAAQQFTPEQLEKLPDVLSVMYWWNQMLTWGWVGIVAAVLLARALRVSQLPRGTTVQVSFADRASCATSGREGLTLSEIARLGEVPMAGLCRGRGRCGTCRVRVLRGQALIPEPGKLERMTLDRLGQPPGVRLSCQMVPKAGEIEVERLVSPDYSDLDAISEDQHHDVEAPA